MNDRLGHLEEMILFMVMLVHEEAYGITVRDAFTEQYGQDISLSAVHTVLRRLEEKGVHRLQDGRLEPGTGGRRKRLYQVTRYGYKMITQIQDERTRIWELLPKLNF